MKNKNNLHVLLMEYTCLLVISVVCLLPVNYCAAEPTGAPGAEIEDVQTPVAESALPEGSPDLQPQQEESPPPADALLPGDMPPQPELPPVDEPVNEPAPVDTPVSVESMPSPSDVPLPADLPPPADITATQETNPENSLPRLPDDVPATAPRQEP